jgi:pimeloyl-ACP methyl ester carboxylesterase
MWGASKLVKMPLYILPAHRAERLKVLLYKKAGSDIMLLPHMRLTFSRIIKDDVQQVAGNIKVPTLLIYATKDKETPVEYGRLLSRAIKGSDLEIIDGAGHFVHQEKSAQVANLIKDFLAAKE